ncbi:MAG: LemA family protein [Bacilli bacterium]|nr:LemA family protein [Bacilli bacterium]
MPNELDELDESYVNKEGRDVHVIEKKVGVKLEPMDKFVNVAVWFIFIIGGLVYAARKTKAKNYFQQLQQKIQKDASTIDNYQLQRVTVLQNTAKLLDKAIQLDKETFTEIARLRSGTMTDENRNEIAAKLDGVQKSINVAFEQYPDLKAHQDIAAAMQQNNYLQQEITAARELYNDDVFRWNAQIFQHWAKKYVAAKEGYTTRIPFTASQEIKEKSEGVFF